MVIKNFIRLQICFELKVLYANYFFIAEIGINHNGDMKICKKLIDLAVLTGCDAVKFQKI